MGEKSVKKDTFIHQSITITQSITVVFQLCSTAIIYSTSSRDFSLAELSSGLTLTHPPPPHPVPFFSFFSLLPHPLLFLTFSNVKGQHLIEHMVEKEVEELRCDPDLTSSSSQGENEKNKGAASSEAGRHLKTKISPWPSSIPPLHHPSLRFPSFSPWSCLHGNPLRASRPWVCACLVCVCASVCGQGRLVQGTKLRAFFVPALPLVNLSQALQGSSGRERDRGRDAEGELLCDREREREGERQPTQEGR